MMKTNYKFILIAAIPALFLLLFFSRGPVSAQSGTTTTAPLTIIIEGTHPAGSQIFGKTAEGEFACRALTDERQTCVVNVKVGADLVLSAETAEGAIFRGWQGTCASNTTTCAFNFRGARTIAATWDQDPNASNQFLQIKGAISFAEPSATTAKIQGQITNLILLRQLLQPEISVGGQDISNLTLFRVEYGVGGTYTEKSGFLFVDQVGNFSVTLENLIPDSIYQFRIAGVFNILKPSAPSSFRTKVATGVLAETYATKVRKTTAIIEGVILNPEPQKLLLRLEYGKTESGTYTNQGDPIFVSPLGNFFSVELSGLEPGVQYQYRVYDTTGRLAPSQSGIFTTATTDISEPELRAPAVITHSYPTQIKEESATIEGSVQNQNAAQLRLQIEYEQRNSVGSFSHKGEKLQIVGEGNFFSVDLANLLPGIEYQYRIFQYEVAPDQIVLAPSETGFFRTAGVSYINAVSQVSNTSSDSVTIEGYILNSNPSAMDQLALAYSEDASYSAETPFTTDQFGNWRVVLSGLKPSTTYNYIILDGHGLLQPTPAKKFTTFAATPGTPIATGTGVSKDYKGLVPPCTDRPVPSGTECVWGWEELMILVKNIIDFMIFFLSLPLAAIAFAYAGFLFLTSAGDTSKVSKARGIFTKVGMGLVIALAAWLIVNTILTTLITADKLESYSLLKNL